MTIGDDTLPAIANTVHTTIIEQVINTLAGVIYHDIDASQTYTDADEPVDNILVRLYDADGTEIATTRTRADGVYIFD